MEIFGLDSGDELRNAVALHLRHALPSSLVNAVAPRDDGSGKNIVSLYLRVGWSSHSVEEIASWLQWDRKTIWRHLHESALRPLHALLDIGCLAHAARRLDEGQAPIGLIAQSIDVDIATLRRISKRETGYSPTQLRRRGAVQTYIERVSAYSAPR